MSEIQLNGKNTAYMLESPEVVSSAPLCKRLGIGFLNPSTKQGGLVQIDIDKYEKLGLYFLELVKKWHGDDASIVLFGLYPDIDRLELVEKTRIVVPEYARAVLGLDFDNRLGESKGLCGVLTIDAEKGFMDLKENPVTNYPTSELF